ncbi:hypothetical protein GPECTOR_85g331 [Gonium pectorale]|uniref:Protein ZIP4 homolog n=1 Tax=Gonium pectorale TaxID=33097 RepID=A0A150G1B3_GONPE|nr:hypothetical protein GPECTOR_85g331 [Gonium pectorale]|eukprot:KXZ43601.1 hypothetical protein GPECTOR_85g331 [Gonium pectorale]
MLRRARELADTLQAVRHYDERAAPPALRGRAGDALPAPPPGASAADWADTLVQQLRSALTALRAAAPRRGGGGAAGGDAAGAAAAAAAPPSGPPAALLPTDELELWRVAGTLWNHAVELANMEALRAGGASLQSKMGREGDCDGEEEMGQGSEVQMEGDDGTGGGGRGAEGAAPLEGRRRQVRARRRRVLTHIACVRQLAVEAAALVPSQVRLPAAAGGGGGGLAPGEAHVLLEKARWRLMFSTAAGRSWLRLGQPEAAEMCLSRVATSADGAAGSGGLGRASACASAGLSSVEREELLVAVFELQLTRTQVLWRLGQQALAGQTLAECSSMARDAQVAGRPDLSCVLAGWLAQLYELVTHAVQSHQASMEGAAAAADGGVDGGGGGGLDPEAVAAREDALVDLRDQVLAWLALCHLAGGDPAACAACCAALREAGSALAEGPELAALETRAQAAAGELDSALAGAEALAARGDAGVELVWETLGALLADPRVRTAPEALWPAVAALQSRLPYDASVSLEFLQAVYDIRGATAAERGGAEALAPTDRLAIAVLDGTCGSGGAPSGDGDAPAAAGGMPAAVRRLRRPQGASAAAAAMQGEEPATQGPQPHDGWDERLSEQQRAAAWLLLWNRGCAHFERRSWAAALRFFGAAAAFAGGPGEAARAHQSGALCLLALQRPDEALALVDQAAAASAEAGVEGPRPAAAITFLRFKVLLVSGKVAEAQELAPALSEAEARSPGLLAVACQEAASARAWPAAKQLLLAMHAAAAADTDADVAAAAAAVVSPTGGGGGGGTDRRPRSTLPEGHILRVLIRCVEDEARQRQKQQGDPKPAKGGLATNANNQQQLKRPGSQQQPQQPNLQGVVGTKDQQGAAHATGGGGGGAAAAAAAAATHEELARYLGLVADRLDAVGPAAFFRGASSSGPDAAAGGSGSGEGGVADAGGAAPPSAAAAAAKGQAEQLEWFAWTAWNTGLAAGAAAEAGLGGGGSSSGAEVSSTDEADGDGGGGGRGPTSLQACAVLMRSAGRLLGRLPPSPRVLGCRRVAFALAAAAALQRYNAERAAAPAGALAGGGVDVFGGNAGIDGARQRPTLQAAAHAVRLARAAAADAAAAAVAAGRPAPPPDKCDVLVASTELRVLLAQRAPPSSILAALSSAGRAFPPGPTCSLTGSALLPIAAELADLAAADIRQTAAAADAEAEGRGNATDYADAAVEDGGGGTDDRSRASGGGVGGGYTEAAVAAYQQALQRLTAALDVDYDLVSKAPV